MCCCFSQGGGFAAIFAWDLVWLVVDLALLATMVALAIDNFHHYKAAEVLCAFTSFTLVSVVRPITYCVLKKKDFSSTTITGVCVVRICTTFVWLICLLCIEAVQQFTLASANSANGNETYATSGDNDADQIETLNELNFSFRLIIGYFVIVFTFLINFYIVHQIRRQDEGK